MNGEYVMLLKVNEGKLNEILERFEKAQYEIRDCAFELQKILSVQIDAKEAE